MRVTWQPETSPVRADRLYTPPIPVYSDRIRPWTRTAVLVLWHPESPGVRLTVRRRLPWWRRSPFATLREVLRTYRN